MAVFPDRIVLKNSSDSNEDIRAAIADGGSESITVGELVISTRSTNPAIYIKDSNGDIQTVAGGGGGGGGGSQVIVKNSPPVTKEDGSPLVLGDVWFNPLDGFLYLYSTDQKSYLYENTFPSVQLLGPWGLATSDNSAISPTLPYTESLIINKRADQDRIFWDLLPGYNGSPIAVYASIDSGASWESGFLKKGFYQASTPTAQSGDIITSGVIDTFNWSTAQYWRFSFEDPETLGWVQVEAEQLVKSVNDKTGFVSLGITDMNDYGKKVVDINNTSPYNGVNIFAEDALQIVYSEYLDAQSVANPTPAPTLNEWTMYYVPELDVVRFTGGNAPQSITPSWNDLPDPQPGVQYYAQIVVSGPFPDPLNPVEDNAIEVIKTIPLTSYTVSTDGINIEWDLKYLNPTDLYWGFTIGNPDRVATTPPLAVFFSVAISPELSTTDDTKTGDFLIYNEQLEEWVPSTPPVQEIADLLDVKRLPGARGTIYKYQGLDGAQFSTISGGQTAGEGKASTEWPNGGRQYLVCSIVDSQGLLMDSDPAFTAKLYTNTSSKEYLWVSINQGVSWLAYYWEYQDNFFSSPYAIAFKMDNAKLIVDSAVEVWITAEDPFDGLPYQQGDALLYDVASNAFVPQVISIDPPPQSLNDLTDVDTVNPPPINNQALVYNSTTQLWQPLTLAPPGSGGALIAQAVLEEQTTDASGNALFQGLGFWGNLIQMQSDVAAWVTLYTTAAARTADLTRPFGTFATPGSGTLAGFNLSAGIPFQVTPAIPYFNNDVIKTGAIYALARDQAGTVISGAVITINAYGAVRFTVVSGGSFSGT